MRECFIPIDSIRIVDFKNGKMRDISMHHDGFYNYQVTAMRLRPIETFQMRLRKVRTYEEALVIIKETGKLLGE